MFLFLFFRDRFHVHDLGTDVLSNLLDFKLPEVSQLDLHLAPGYGDDPVHRLLDSFPHFHAFTYINLQHFLHLSSASTVTDDYISASPRNN